MNSKHLFGLVVLLAAVVFGRILMNNDLHSSASVNPTRIAVIGDSDSHSYRDSVSGIRRGGEIHNISFNWIETWSRLRS